jgi:Fungal specific transcription factor domain
MRAVLQIWAPRQIPQHLRPTIGNPLASQLFPLALQNPGFFEALVAIAQTYEAAHYTTELQPSKEVLKHCGNALTRVRGQLSSPSAQVDDVAMLTILFLMGVHVGQPCLYKQWHRLIPPVPRR